MFHRLSKAEDFQSGENNGLSSDAIPLGESHPSLGVMRYRSGENHILSGFRSGRRRSSSSGVGRSTRVMLDGSARFHIDAPFVRGASGYPAGERESGWRLQRAGSSK